MSSRRGRGDPAADPVARSASAPGAAPADPRAGAGRGRRGRSIPGHGRYRSPAFGRRVQRCKAAVCVAEVRWQSSRLSRSPPLPLLRCRKAHGSAFATYAAARAGSFSRAERSHARGVGQAFFRPFCPALRLGRSGRSRRRDVRLPAGRTRRRPAVRVEAHISWPRRRPGSSCRATCPLRRLSARHGRPALPEPAHPKMRRGRLRGSCLCGGVGFAIHEARASRPLFCHCGRCRKARVAAHAANLFVPESALVFTRGAERLVSSRSGGPALHADVLPRLRRQAAARRSERKLGGPSDGRARRRPRHPPQEHIYVSSKAAWRRDQRRLARQHAEYAPSA